MENYISRQDFKDLIGWNCGNEPYSWQALKLANGLNGARMGSAKIFKNHYEVYYKYDVIKDIIFYPIVFKMGCRGFVANNKEELIHFLEEIKKENFSVMEKKVEEKVEKMVNSPITDIRNDEISHEDRIVFQEAYDWIEEKYLGYWYVEC